VGTVVIIVPGALDCHYSNNIQQPTLRTIYTCAYTTEHERLLSIILE